MKVGKRGLRMSSGEVRHFRSEQARDNFERVAEAYKHGWRPKESYSSPKHSHPYSTDPSMPGKCLICSMPKGAHRIK